jgi:hypothetical protein
LLSFAALYLVLTSLQLFNMLGIQFDVLQSNGVLATVNVTGTVVEVDEECNLFSLYIWQEVSMLLVGLLLKVNATPCFQATSTGQCQTLPPVHSMISFTGTLQFVLEGIVLVGVDDIGYTLETV